MTTISDLFGVGKPRLYGFPKVADAINPELVIGLELETEGCDAHSGETYQKMVKPCNFKVATDGSLRGSSYEFISYPMRSDHAIAALGDYFKATKFTEANYSDRCSIHVHANCTDITQETLSCVSLLYTVVEEIMFEYVGAHRDSNIYCIPWNQCRQHLDLINRFINDPGMVLRKWNKYTAVNLLPLASQGTIEFRQMHGTADLGKISTWINMIGCLFLRAKETELKVLIEELKSLNSTSQYETFFTRLFRGVIPYNAVYQQKMEEGVIFAKFSLVNMEKKRNSPAKKAGVLPPIDPTVPVWANNFQPVGNPIPEALGGNAPAQVVDRLGAQPRARPRLGDAPIRIRQLGEMLNDRLLAERERAEEGGF